jgi:hypothetical protein
MNATLFKALPDLAAEIDQAHGRVVAAAGVYYHANYWWLGRKGGR